MSSENKNRKEGYYWVKYKGEWLVANYKYNGALWLFFAPGINFGFTENELDKINEPRLEPPQN